MPNTPRNVSSRGFTQSNESCLHATHTQKTNAGDFKTFNIFHESVSVHWTCPAKGNQENHIHTHKNAFGHDKFLIIIPKYAKISGFLWLHQDVAVLGLMMWHALRELRTYRARRDWKKTDDNLWVHETKRFHIRGFVSTLMNWDLDYTRKSDKTSAGVPSLVHMFFAEALMYVVLRSEVQGDGE